MGLMGSGGRLLAGLLLWAVACLAAAQAFNESIDIRMAEAHRGLPDEIDAMAAQLTELAPGLWETSKPGSRRLFLAVAVESRSDRPLPLSPFGLRMRNRQGATVVTFECTPERNQPSAVLLPLRQAAYLCRAETPSSESGAGIASALAAVRAAPELMDIGARESQEQAAQRLARTLARPESRNPAPPMIASAPPIEVRTEEAPRNARRGVSSFENRLYTSRNLQLLLLVVIALAYYGIAKTIGNLRASILFWVLATAYVVSVMAREGLGSGWGGLAMMVVVYPGMLIGAAGLAMAYYYLFAFATSSWDNIKLKVFYLLLGMIAFAFLVLLDRMGF